MKWLDLLQQVVQLTLGQWAQSLAHDLQQDLMRDLMRWRWQLFQSVLLVMLAAVCGLAVLLLVALLVALVLGEPHRLEALGALTLVYALLTAWMVRRAGRLMRPRSAAVASGSAPAHGCGACPACPRSAQGGA